MKYFKKLWGKLDGKKSWLGLGLLFLDGGLRAVGSEVSGLYELGLWVLGAGTVHKLDKIKKK